jgi:hypothetical protein
MIARNGSLAIRVTPQDLTDRDPYPKRTSRTGISVDEVRRG